MRAALLIARFPGAGFEEEEASARAFCAAHGLLPVRCSHTAFLQDRRQTEAFLHQARTGQFQVVVVATPECFPTRVLTALVNAGVGVACHGGRA